MIPVVVVRLVVRHAAPRCSTRPRYLFRFLDNHGMLSVTGSPQWRTVVGGSRSYVERAAKGLSAVETGTGSARVTRHADGVELIDDDGQRHACGRRRRRHPPRPGAARCSATRPTPSGRCSARSTYSRNETLLHTDSRCCPRRRRARASWNYRMNACAGDSDDVQVSYWMNRLQRPRRAGRLPGHAQRHATGSTRPRCCAGWSTSTRSTRPTSVAAQRRLPELNTGRTAFAGAYHGWGFHEDGCASGVRAAATFGAGW